MLTRSGAPKQKARRFHLVEPVPGEAGRFYVDSFGDKEERAYIVEPAAVEETNGGKVIGTCPCKGWQIHKHCSHIDHARDYASNPRAYESKRKAAAAVTLRRPRAVSRWATV